MASKARELANLGNAYSDGALSNRNLIINGAMQVAQRGTSFTSTGYNLDRWTFAKNTNDTWVFSQYDIATGGEVGLPVEFTKAIKLAFTAGGTGGLNDFRQRIEFPERFLGQTVTLSYYARASADTASAITASSRISFNVASNQPATTNLTGTDLTTSWQRFEKTVTLPTSTTMTTNSSSFLDVTFSIKANTTFDIYLTGVQLEVGDTATPFEHRSFGQELALCQRYYYQPEGRFYTASSNNTDAFRNYVTFPCNMRATPSVTQANVSAGTIGTIYTSLSLHNYEIAGADRPAIGNTSPFKFDAEL